MEMPQRYAGFWVRFAANILDSALLTAATWLVGWGALEILRWTSLRAQLLMLGIYSILSLIYFTFFQFRYETTPGKWVFGIFVVRDTDFGPLPLGRSALRAVAYWLSWLPLGAGYLMVGLNERKVALHDMIARSVSIRRLSKGN